MNIAAVIVAAGSSVRMGGGGKKEYLPLPPQAGVSVPPQSVLGAAFSAFASDPRILTIVVVHPVKAEIGETAARKAIGAPRLSGYKGELFFIPGGGCRRASVRNALFLLDAPGEERPDLVLIHDGARPWVDNALISRVIDAAIEHGAAIPTLPCSETPKELDDDGAFVRRHLARSRFSLAQTPQGFHFSKILEAHRRAEELFLAEGGEWTDDGEIYGAFVGRVAAVPGDVRNKKITFREDVRN
ncbi:MAG: 2-C-methyl-D-erythritol 4-phosphate cytidylyltransferase [Spirochaetaceae bacterium]|jgi:2-C-methyl-D-erythritol 4-phosphate cytidylyltransferase/2-C-methyl-D-erythritol 4-phosphate cytidylyltransferase/2-C-methyl-D-erythritol 2,4-cyclodiphosphate synthase|nr:2-C-methyl-D-erythritol 4-phosphate cytidylyltransferase [Spirochaetaceae bacterium]